MKLYVFRTVPLSIIRSLFTLHSAMVYVTQLLSRTRMELVLFRCWWVPTSNGIKPARKLSTNLYDIYHC